MNVDEKRALNMLETLTNIFIWYQRSKCTTHVPNIRYYPLITVPFN